MSLLSVGSEGIEAGVDGECANRVTMDPPPGQIDWLAMGLKLAKAEREGKEEKGDEEEEEEEEEEEDEDEDEDELEE